MDTVYRKELPEVIVPGKRLGRHIEHDPRSKAYGVNRRLDVKTLVDVEHQRVNGVFDQLKLGSCTGNAAGGACNTFPLFPSRAVRLPTTGEMVSKILAESDAVDIYSRGTKIDNIPGTYPPNDTGSSGLAVAKACQDLGYIDSYVHAFGIDDVLAALQRGPIIVGVEWLEGFDTPTTDHALVLPTGQARGGHEVLLRGFAWNGAAKVNDAWLKFDNSWGESYGEKGSFYMTVKTLDDLLHNDGDATVLLPLGAKG